MDYETEGVVDSNELSRMVSKHMGWDTGYLDDGFVITIEGIGTFLADEIVIGYDKPNERFTISVSNPKVA